jgi:hypothetical protein
VGTGVVIDGLGTGETVMVRVVEGTGVTIGVDGVGVGDPCPRPAMKSFTCDRKSFISVRNAAISFLNGAISSWTPRPAAAAKLATSGKAEFNLSASPIY